MSAALAKSRAHHEKETRRDAVINVRIPSKTKELIDTAAAVMGKTRTEFVLESAKQHAVDVLLDQRLFSLPEQQFEAFLEVLDNPPPPVQKLRDLFNEKDPWER
jgi:Uncharacterized protein conserved in bacteria